MHKIAIQTVAPKNVKRKSMRAFCSMIHRQLKRQPPHSDLVSVMRRNTHTETKTRTRKNSLVALTLSLSLIVCSGDRREWLFKLYTAQSTQAQRSLVIFDSYGCEFNVCTDGHLAAAATVTMVMVMVMVCAVWLHKTLIDISYNR